MSTDQGSLGGISNRPFWWQELDDLGYTKVVPDCSAVETLDFEDALVSLARGLLKSDDNGLERAERLLKSVEGRRVLFNSCKSAENVKLRLKGVIDEIKKENELNASRTVVKGYVKGVVQSKPSDLRRRR